MMSSFGMPVRFAADTPLRFQDLTLRYLGARHSTHGGPGAQPIVFRDFDATHGAHTARVTWSSGTGDIAPVQFQLGKQGYILELGASILSNKALADDELVLWREHDFLARFNRSPPAAQAGSEHIGMAAQVMRLPDPRVVVNQWAAQDKRPYAEVYEQVLAEFRKAGQPYRLVSPAKGERVCQRCSRMYRIPTGHVQVIHPGQNAAIDLDQMLLHEVAEHGQLFTPEQVEFLRRLPVSRSVPASSLRLVLSTDKALYRHGEPVRVQLRLENLGPTLVVLQGIRPLRNSANPPKLELQATDGTVMRVDAVDAGGIPKVIDTEQPIIVAPARPVTLLDLDIASAPAALRGPTDKLFQTPVQRLGTRLVAGRYVLRGDFFTQFPSFSGMSEPLTIAVE